MNKVEAAVMRRDGPNPRVLVTIAIIFLLVVAAVLAGYLV
jgi:hypothetical protein